MSDTPEYRKVCTACGHIDGAHLSHCRIAELECELAAALKAKEELQCYEKAWHEWRSLQTGDAQKLFDAALRCEAAEKAKEELQKAPLCGVHAEQWFCDRQTVPTPCWICALTAAKEEAERTADITITGFAKLEEKFREQVLRAEKAERDAQRYHFLASRGYRTSSLDPPHWCIPETCGLGHGIDAAIDAARGKNG